MRVLDVLKLFETGTSVTIKARITIFGRLHDVVITNVKAVHGKAEIDIQNLMLMYEEIIEIQHSSNDVILVVSGCY